MSNLFQIIGLILLIIFGVYILVRVGTAAHYQSKSDYERKDNGKRRA